MSSRYLFLFIGLVVVFGLLQGAQYLFDFELEWMNFFDGTRY